jgi:hypothetical protein
VDTATVWFYVRGTVTTHEKINVISQSEVLTQDLQNIISKQAYEVVGTTLLSDDRYPEFHLCEVGKEWWC